MKSFIFISIALLGFSFSRAQTYFSTLKIISSGLIDTPWTCTAGDVDGDGDMDVLAGGAYANLVYFENLDGAGNFGAEQVISTSIGGAICVQGTDLDGDGDLDLISTGTATRMLLQPPIITTN